MHTTSAKCKRIGAIYDCKQNTHDYAADIGIAGLFVYRPADKRRQRQINDYREQPDADDRAADMVVFGEHIATGLEEAILQCDQKHGT